VANRMDIRLEWRRTHGDLPDNLGPYTTCRAPGRTPRHYRSVCGKFSHMYSWLEIVNFSQTLTLEQGDGRNRHTHAHVDRAASR
jgi:hypothetical protein